MQRQYDQAALLPESPWKQNRWPAAAASMHGAASVPPMTGRALPTTYARWSDWSRQEAQIRADAGRLTLRRAAGYFRTGYDQRAAGQPVLRSQIVATFLLSRAVEKQAKQTLIAPQGLSPLPNNGSWACRRCVSLALTSTAGASTSAPTRSAAAYPGCAHHHPLQRKRPAQRSVRRDPRNRPRPLRAESTSPVGRPARRTRPLHRYPRVAEPVFEMQLGRSERFLNRLLPAVRERFGDRPAFSRTILSHGISR